MLPSSRRYDLDWVRVIAIGLLIIYHTAIGFQPWGIMIGFIANEKSWASLWIPMTMLNVWRIPLLFFVSGMGVHFSIQNRNWKQLIIERARRIGIPYLFGMILVVPVSVFIWQYHYQMPLHYDYNPGHLWFLGNILVYVVLLVPVFYYLKRNENGWLVNWVRRILSHPLGLLPVVGAFIAEAVWVNPNPYELYAMTWHGFFLGFLAFFFGFCFVLAADSFWKMLVKWRWLFVIMAISLYTHRLFQYQMRVEDYLLAIESNCWIFSVFAFANKYLNRPGKALNYLSQAVYPVYILHMIFLYLGSMLIFPLDIDVRIQFALVMVFTLIGCFGTYEFIIRRAKLIRTLFGLKVK